MIQFPNSYMSTDPTSRAPTFDPSKAEAPWRAASDVVSRHSHWTHEGEPSEYDQVRELYTRVMTDTQRAHLHFNTAKLLSVCLISWLLARRSLAGFRDTPFQDGHGKPPRYTWQGAS